MVAPSFNYDGYMGPTVDDVLDEASRAAGRIACSEKGWPGAQVRWLFFVKKGRRGWVRSEDDDDMTTSRQWFVYMKGSSGIWLGEDGKLYCPLTLSQKGGFALITRFDIRTLFESSIPQLTVLLHKICRS